jgi:signal transduction histidine kinase
VLQGAARLAAGQIGPNITVTLNVPEDLILHMDGQRLQEAFINLLLNASQAIGRRQGRIEVTATDKTEQVLITMADTGDGMSEKTLQRLFDPFFSTKPVGRGTGLGLSIVYGIIEEHGGSIRVESRPGSGSVFFIQLPKQPEEATA